MKLGYAEADDIMKAKAEQHGLPFIELREIEIPPSVIELVPESLARKTSSCRCPRERARSG